MPTLERPAPTGQEQRYLTLERTAVTRRDAGDGNDIEFRGHAAMFDRRTWIGPTRWGFWEQVARGAFSKSIGESDVRFLINHDPNLVLARSTTGTLRLAEDSVGLAVDADLAPTSYGLDLAISLERGDVTQMSFAFEVIREEWQILGDETELRTILEAKLWDVSAVTYPAYDDTDAQLRAQAFDVFAHKIGLSTRKRSKIVAALAHDEPGPEAIALLRDVQANLASFLERSAPVSATPPVDEGAPAPATATRDAQQAEQMRRHQMKHHQLTAARHGFAATS